MLKIDKRLNIPVQLGTVTNRMALYLEDSEKAGFVSYIERLRRWCIVGFQLQEIGGGVLEGWQAMERDGELNDMSRSDKARVLSGLLQRVIDSEEKQPPPQTQTQTQTKPVETSKKPLKPISSLSNNTV